MNTYEINVELVSGYTLNMLVAAPEPLEATQSAAKVLASVGVHNGRHYTLGEMQVKPVMVTPSEVVPVDFWDPAPTASHI